jgi:diguanylate cyclase (GGDEF)-like protein
LPNEVITQDLVSHLASPEAAEMLRAFEQASEGGATPTVALLDSTMMKRMGRHIALLEHHAKNGLTVLYAGPEVPDDDGKAIGGRSVAGFHGPTRTFYEQGALSARGCDTGVLMRHRTTMNAPVHQWECLFLPLAEKAGAPRNLVAVFCKSLEPKHSFFRLILDHLPHAAMLVEQGSSGTPMAVAEIVAANKAAIHLLGHQTLDSLLTRPLAEAFAQADTEDGWMRLVAEMTPGLTARFEYNHRCEASARWFDVQLAPVSKGLMITLSDITDLKRTILDLEHQRKALMEEMEQRRTLEEELWALAHLDPLTGLPNRRAFRDEATSTLITAQTLHRPCAMISIDIDHFKRVNDTHGHGAGDVVLRRVADILKAPLRPEVDIAARLGGEEFAVLLPDTELAGARAFAEMLRHRVEHTVVIAGEGEIRPTISLGVAMVTSDGDLDNLIDRSDRALYAAKRAGRNRVTAEGEVQDEQAAA